MAREQIVTETEVLDKVYLVLSDEHGYESAWLTFEDAKEEMERIQKLAAYRNISLRIDEVPVGYKRRLR